MQQQSNDRDHNLLREKSKRHRVFELRHLLGIVRSLSCAIYSTQGMPSKNGTSRLDQRRLLKSNRPDFFVLRLNLGKTGGFCQVS